MGLRKVQFGAIEGTVEFETARKRKLLEQSRSFDFRAPHKQYECACNKGEPNQWIVRRNPKKLFPHRFALSSSIVRLSQKKSMEEGDSCCRADCEWDVVGLILFAKIKM